MEPKKPKIKKERPPKIVIPKGSKFKTKFCSMLMEHMRDGLSYASFAGVAGVCRDTLYEWEKLHPDWASTKKLAWELCRLYWDKKARDCPGKDMFSIGKNLENRFPDQWGSKARDPLLKDKSVRFAYPQIKTNPKDRKKPTPIIKPTEEEVV